MTLVLSLLVVQGIFGAFDNLWHHEITEKLPQKLSARFELVLHTVREMVYAVLFLALAWWSWHGAFAAAIAALFIFEVIITLWDFIIEDMTRKLPAFERVLHTILAMNVGAILLALAPVLWSWWTGPSAVQPADYGALSYIMTVYAAGVFAWSLRDGLAVYLLGRRAKNPIWQRQPIAVTRQNDPQHILITGGTGFIGQHLCRKLIGQGHVVWVLTRDPSRAEELYGPHIRSIDALDALPRETRIDHIISLAGAPVVGLPWTARRRKTLIESRTKMTQRLATLISRLDTAPKTVVSASAVGFYGNRADESLTEGTPAGSGFMAKLCETHETNLSQLSQTKIRLCILRFGIVLGTDGGALPRFSQPIRFGLGAFFGHGQQYFPWLHIADAVGVIQHCLNTPALSGVINAVAPERILHQTFMAALATRLNRRIRLRVPGRVLHLGLGEMSDIFLAGQNVVPAKLSDSRYRFRFASLGSALDDLFPSAEPHKSTALTVHYNAQCKVCRTEIEHYARKAKTHNAQLRFAPICAIGGPTNAAVFNADELRRRLHASTEDGRMISGTAVFVAIWSRLPGYRWAAWLVGLPGLRILADFAYERVLVPLLWRINKRSRAQRQQI